MLLLILLRFLLLLNELVDYNNVDNDDFKL